MSDSDIAGIPVLIVAARNKVLKDTILGKVLPWPAGNCGATSHSIVMFSALPENLSLDHQDLFSL